ncbi:MAG: UDP-N-acetylmuramoyl-L-alanine--D-glutamate ligase [Candidatus Hydrothermia bacterium]
MKKSINAVKYAGKKVSILGCGKSGFESALALQKCGATVFVSDISLINEAHKKELMARRIEYEENGHTERVLAADLIVLSPAVKPELEILKKAEERGIEIVGELEIGYQLTSGEYIAITGTNGKSTVTELTYQLFKDVQKEVYCCGNIGDPLSMFAFKNGIFVLETSSFQLRSIREFRPDYATILNIDRDHMDWHPDFDDYINSKARIFENQTDEDYLILNYDDSVVRSLESKAKPKIIWVSLQSELQEGVYLNRDRNTVYFQLGDEKISLFKVSDLRIAGNHNIFNAAVASTFAYLEGLGLNHIQRTLRNFKGLPHRIEFVLEKNGIKFFDDSKGTNPHAVASALNGINAPCILIMGGEDKDLDFSSLREPIKKHCKAIIAIGKATPKILKTFSDKVKVVEATDMEDAVRKSFQNANAGDVVLLSPGCASFDMFKNYKERGDVFQYWVKKVAEEN